MLSRYKLFRILSFPMKVFYITLGPYLTCTVSSATQLKMFFETLRERKEKFPSQTSSEHRVQSTHCFLLNISRAFMNKAGSCQLIVDVCTGATTGV